MTRPPRWLAYKDRYVWSLVQSLTGGSSVLPPVQFSPGVETELIVSFTQERWNQTFAALMAGADLLYPDEAHEVVWNLLKYVEYPMPAIGFGFDSEINLWAHEAEIVTGNALLISPSTSVLHNVVALQNPPTVNSTLRWWRYMAAGEWAYSYLWHRRTNGGLVTCSAYPSPGSGSTLVINSVDTRGTTLDNQFTRGTFTLPETKLYHIDMQVYGSSSGANYGNTFTLMQMWRTGP